MPPLTPEQLTQLTDYVREVKKDIELATERSLQTAADRLDVEATNLSNSINQVQHNLMSEVTKLQTQILRRLHKVDYRLQQLDKQQPEHLADKITDLAVRTTAQIADKTDAIHDEIRHSEQNIQTNLHTIDARNAADLSRLAGRVHHLEARVPATHGSMHPTSPPQQPTNSSAQSATAAQDLARALNNLLSLQNLAWFQAHHEHTKSAHLRYEALDPHFPKHHKEQTKSPE